MRIGIDLDGVIFDSERELRIYTEIYDVLELKKSSIIDNTKRTILERYSWTEKEKDDFIQKYYRQIVEECNFMPGAKKVLELLKKDGHTLAIISARGDLLLEAREVAIRRLKENHFTMFDEYYWTNEKKDIVCKEKNIDILIDDYTKICKRTSEVGVKTIYFRDTTSIPLPENKYIKEVTNWGEIYRYIHGLSLEEKNEK